MPYIKKKGKASSHEIKKATTKKISAVVKITDASKLPSRFLDLTACQPKPTESQPKANYN